MGYSRYIQEAAKGRHGSPHWRPQHGSGPGRVRGAQRERRGSGARPSSRRQHAKTGPHSTHQQRVPRRALSADRHHHQWRGAHSNHQQRATTGGNKPPPDHEGAGTLPAGKHFWTGHGISKTSASTTRATTTPKPQVIYNAHSFGRPGRPPARRTTGSTRSNNYKKKPQPL